MNRWWNRLARKIFKTISWNIFMKIKRGLKYKLWAKNMLKKIKKQNNKEKQKIVLRIIKKLA